MWDFNAPFMISSFCQCEKLDWKPNNVMEKVNLNLRGDLVGQGTIRTFSCKSTTSSGKWNVTPGSSLTALISSCPQIIPGTTSVLTLTLAATFSAWSMPAQESEYSSKKDKGKNLLDPQWLESIRAFCMS